MAANRALMQSRREYMRIRGRPIPEEFAQRHLALSNEMEVSVFVAQQLGLYRDRPRGDNLPRPERPIPQ